MCEESIKLAEKINKNNSKLSDLFFINVGIKPYQKGKGKPPQTRQTVKSRLFDSDNQIDELLPTISSRKRYSKIYNFSNKFRFIKYGIWLAEPRQSANFDAPLKIFMRQTGDSLVAVVDDSKYLCLNNMHVLVPKRIEISPYFILGLLNSRMMNWYYQTLNPEVGEALAEVKKTNVEKLPIKVIDFKNPNDVKQHNRMVSLVERMMELHKRSPKTPQEHDQLQREIAATDAAIDHLVYQLYNLTDKEIRIVEGGGS